MVRSDTSWFTRSGSNCSWPTTPRQPLKKLNAARVRALDARVMGRCGLEGACDVQARSRPARTANATFCANATTSCGATRANGRGTPHME
jgi:hypothetical protein